MSKLTLALCVVFAFMVMAIFAQTNPSIAISFVENRIIKDSSSYIDLKFNNIYFGDSDYPITLTPDEGKATGSYELWAFSTQVASSIEMSNGYAESFCHDNATGQVVAKVSTSSSSQTKIVPTAYAEALVSAITDSAKKAQIAWDIRCPIQIDTSVTPTVFTISPTAYGVDGTTLDIADITLEMPTNGFVTAAIDFKKASIKQEKSDPFTTSELTIEFTTDTPGQYVLGVQNGPTPYPSNLNNGKFAEFFCSAGSNKQFARIVYDSGVYLDVPTGVNAKDTIKCSILLSNADLTTFVRSQRVIVQLSFGTSVVSRAVDYKLAPAAVFAQFASSTILSQYIQIETTRFTGSKVSINTNSTIEFKFSKQVDVSKILLEEKSSSSTSYQRNVNCGGIAATSYVDNKANTITLKDAIFSSPVTSLQCYFQISDVSFVNWKNKVDMASVEVIVDGVKLVSALTPGSAAPIYIDALYVLSPAVDGHVETETETQITVVDSFNLQDVVSDAQLMTIMRNPQLFVSIQGPTLFNIEDYKNQITCEATSPISTAFSKLDLKFDEKMLTWSVQLKDLIEVESYNIIIKCTRVVPIVTKFGIDITPLSTLVVGVVNLIDGKRALYNSITGSKYTSVNMNSRTVVPAADYAGEFPTNSVGSICFTADFIAPSMDASYQTQADKVLKDAATKYLATISTGWTVADDINNGYIDLTTGSNYLNINAAPAFVPIYSTNTNQLKSYEIPTLPLFSQLNNDASNAIIDLYSEVGAFDVTASQCFTIAKSGSTDSSPSFTMTADEFKAEINNASFQFIRASSIVNRFNSNLSLGNAHSIPTSCGVSSLIFDASSIDYKYTASDLATVTHSSKLCPVDAKCTYNADCESHACQKNVCVLLQTYNPPFIMIDIAESATKAMDKDYYSSATMTSISIAIVAAVVAVMF